MKKQIEDTGGGPIKLPLLPNVGRRTGKAVWGLLLSLLGSSGSLAAPSEETVYFDLPEALEPAPIPVPTAAVAALPGYPDDPGRFTLAARLFLPDPEDFGSGPFPAVLILHGSGGLWSNDVIANGLADQEVATSGEVPAPVRIPDALPFPKVCAFFYSGGSHYGYHGQASSTAAGRYMFDRRTRGLMFHGTVDSLLGVDDTSVQPMTGTLFPIKQVLASTAQADLLGLPDPLQHHFLLHEAGHSFDGVAMADEVDWNTPDESPDQKAKRLCQEEVLKWFEFCLKPGPALAIAPDGTDPDGVALSGSPTSTRARYQWEQSDNLTSWTDLDSPFDGSGQPALRTEFDEGIPRRFFRLRYFPQLPPTAATENTGFFSFGGLKSYRGW